MKMYVVTERKSNHAYDRVIGTYANEDAARHLFTMQCLQESTKMNFYKIHVCNVIETISNH